MHSSLNFCYALDCINDKRYISIDESNEYIIVNNKDEKNLNTLKIAELAEKYFNDFESLNQRLVGQEIALLEQSLKVYKRRLYSSKKWYQKIGGFFGFKSQAEKRIDLVINAIWSNQSINLSKFYVFTTKFYLFTRFFENDLKLFYHKVDSHIYIEALDGNQFGNSIASILNDLKHFSMLSSNPTITQVIEELEFTLELTQQDTDKHAFAKQILTKLQQLTSSSPAKKNAVVICGGPIWHHPHAILHVIEKQKNGNYIFSTINTGDGLTRLKFHLHLDDQGIAHVPDQVAVNGDELSACYSFCNLPKEVLSETFFQEMLENRIESKGMSDINAFINNKLHQGDLKYDIAIEIQRQGTCSMRCIMAFLKTRLDIVDYEKFYKFMIKREIHKFDNNRWLKLLAKIDPLIAKLRLSAENLI